MYLFIYYIYTYMEKVQLVDGYIYISFKKTEVYFVEHIPLMNSFHELQNILYFW